MRLPGHLLLLLFLLGFPLPVSGIEVDFSLRDAVYSQPLHAHCNLQDSKGEYYHPMRATPEVTHASAPFLTEGDFHVVLPRAGDYRLTVDRGMLWKPHDQVHSITQTGSHITINISPFIIAAKKNWFTGDLEARVPSEDIEKLMRTQDLNLIGRPLPPLEAIKEPGAVKHHTGWIAYRHRDWAFEEFNVIGTMFEITENETPFRSSEMGLMNRAHELDGFVDILRPEMDDAAVAAALGWLDAVRVVGPINSPEETWTEEQVLERFEAYYNLLNCGFKIPISAGSCATESGFGPEDRIGRARLFARVLSTFTYGYFMKACRTGNSFGTNGPILSFLAGSKFAGEELLLKSGSEINVALGARSRNRIDRVEILYNGEIVSASGPDDSGTIALAKLDLPVGEGGWIVGRAFEERSSPEEPIRYAHTSPIYLRVGDEQPVDKQQPQKFATAITGRIRKIKNQRDLSDWEREKLIEWHSQARDFYLDLAR